MSRGSNLYNLSENSLWSRLCEHRIIDNYITATQRESEICQLRHFMEHVNERNNVLIQNQLRRITGIKRVIAGEKDILHHLASNSLPKDQSATMSEYIATLKKLLPLEDNIALGQDVARGLSVAKLSYNLKLFSICLAMRKEYEAGQQYSDSHAVAMAELDASLIDPNDWQEVVVVKLMRYSKEAANKLGDADIIVATIEGLMA